jgi:hypothetical protein
MEVGHATRGEWLSQICWHEDSITWSTLPDSEAMVSPYLIIDTCLGGLNTISPYASQLTIRAQTSGRGATIRGVNRWSRCCHEWANEWLG